MIDKISFLKLKTTQIGHVEYLSAVIAIEGEHSLTCLILEQITSRQHSKRELYFSHFG